MTYIMCVRLGRSSPIANSLKSPLSHQHEERDGLTLLRMEMMPLKRPTAKYWPSLVQAQLVARDDTFNLVTAFCSGLHSPIRFMYMTLILLQELPKINCKNRNCHTCTYIRMYIVQKPNQKHTTYMTLYIHVYTYAACLHLHCSSTHSHIVTYQYQRQCS